MPLVLSELQRRALEIMDIPVWEQVGEAPDSAGARIDPAHGEDVFAELSSEVAACTRCALHTSRTQTVFGVGDPRADWLVIGEAPGAEEDRQGEPFVGRAGQLLNEMLRALGLSREQVYTANILKCRPPDNRDPKSDEVAECRRYLQRQIDMIRPRIILAVGRVAAQNLLHSEQPVGRMRGRVHHYAPGEIPVVVTYHPAYLLRSPGEKRKSWQDLCLARAALQGGVG